MKITAIRMAEFGKFDQPIALEGLSGGLDVLAGPNELGKSTILAATKLALTTKHSARTGKIEAFRPYRGGAPTVEIEFESAGRTWRLFKRWMAKPSAELRDRASGQLYRGPEAEAELERLLTLEGTSSKIPLLWLDQGHSTETFAVPSSARGLIDSAIAGEIAAMTGSDRARRVRQRVQDALDDLVTRARQQPTKAYEEARRRVKERSDALAKARAKLAQIEDQLRLLSDTRERERAISDPVATAARHDALLRAKDSLAAGQRAKALADQAAHERRAAEARHALALREFTEFEGAVAQLDNLDRLDAADARDASEAAAALAGMTADNVTQQRAIEALRATIAALHAEHAQAVSAQHRESARSRLPQIIARLAAAQAAAERIAGLAVDLSAIRATRTGLDAARREAASLRDLETRLSAAAALVTIDYAPGAHQRIRVSGRELADGDTLTADRALVLDIEGIGILTVRPGGGAATEETARQRDAHRLELERLCTAAGTTDLAGFEQGVAARQQLESELNECRGRLQGLAPDGIAALDKSHADARAEAGEEPATPTRPLSQIEEDLTIARAKLTEIDAALAKTSTTLARQREADAGRVAGARERVTRRDQLASTLPHASERAARRAAAAAALTEAETAANDAARTHSAWNASAPDDAALAGLTAAVVTAQETLDRMNRELQELRTTAAHADGSLVSLRNEDIASVVAELTDEVAEAEAVVRRFEAEVAALRRLEHELAAEAAANEAQLLEPIKARLFPYLHLLFPGANAHVDAAFGLRELARSGTNEQLDRLSDGTREQIAVLARLAFARLLADSGRSAPVILDDALVFADDERMLRLFRALEEAANWHQVIVLTCHERSFADLAGHRVKLKAWEQVPA